MVQSLYNFPLLISWMTPPKCEQIRFHVFDLIVQCSSLDRCKINKLNQLRPLLLGFMYYRPDGPHFFEEMEKKT